MEVAIKVDRSRRLASRNRKKEATLEQHNLVKLILFSTGGALLDRGRRGGEVEEAIFSVRRCGAMALSVFGEEDEKDGSFLGWKGLDGWRVF